MAALINVPAKAKRGDVIEIKTLMSHIMEPGYRRTAEGSILPRDIITSFTCRYNGAEIFRAGRHAVSNEKKRATGEKIDKKEQDVLDPVAEGLHGHKLTIYKNRPAHCVGLVVLLIRIEPILHLGRDAVQVGRAVVPIRPRGDILAAETDSEEPATDPIDLARARRYAVGAQPFDLADRLDVRLEVTWYHLE